MAGAIRKKSPICRQASTNDDVDFKFKPKGFIINKKLCVYIYHHTITDLKVDAIVLPDDRRECVRAIQSAIDEHSSIASGGRPGLVQVITTSAGDRPCKFILYVASPSWDDDEDNVAAQQTRIEELRRTYLNIFQTAGGKGCKSVACPLIGNTGTMAFPLPYEAGIIHDTIVTLDVKRIKEVHMVSVSDTKLQAIYEVFELAEKSSGGHIVGIGEGRVMHSIERKMTKRPYESSQAQSPTSGMTCVRNESVPECTWHYRFEPAGYRSRSTSIYVHICDITDLLLDAYVNSTVEYFDTYGGSSTIITEKGSPKISAKYVLQAAIPDKEIYVTKHGLPSYLKKLTETFQSLTEEVKRHGITSIAFPPIFSADGAISQAAEIMCRVLQEAIEEGSSLRQVHFVDTSRDTLELIGSLLESLALKPIPLEEVERSIASVTTNRSLTTNATSHRGYIRATPTQTGDKDMDMTNSLNKFQPPVSVSSKCTANLHPGALYITDVSINGHLDEKKRSPDNANATTKKTDSDREVCVICLEEIVNPEVLKCKHTFCKPCISHLFKTYTPKCPSCGVLHGAVKGNQPDGKMEVTFSETELPGHEGHGSIWIDYSFDSGLQRENHPNPGVQYMGSARTAFLPDTDDGREVLKLLEKAFEAKVLFTIGRSVTTGCDNVVTWNDVHHKTSIDGGPTEYGYPDPTYLTRVKDELAAKGIM